MTHHRKHLFALAVSALLMALYACTQDAPVHPILPPVPDTTSHDWVFSMHRLSYGIAPNRMSSISALSPDFVVMAGEGNGSIALLWDGSGIQRINLPHRYVDLDTCRTCYPPLARDPVESVWFFRRDNFWIGSISQAQHTTVSASDRDTMIFVSGAAHTPGFGGSHIWAMDSTNVFFARFDASRVSRWRHRERSWDTYPLTWPDMPWDNRVYDFWGTSNQSVFLHTTGGLRHFDGVEWRTIWNREMPSLCDSVLFGTPVSAWAASDDDSMWIAGLFIGRMRKDGAGRVTYRSKLGLSNSQYDVRCVRGSAKNNVFFVGVSAYIGHYNGASFKVFDEFAGQGIAFRKVVVFENEVFIIGDHPFMGGIFVHGRRR